MSISVLMHPRTVGVSLEDRLEELLSESVESAVRREQTAFDEMASPFERSLVLFGCGGLGRKTLAGLRKAGVEPLAFADNNPARWGTTVDGVCVLAPSAAAAEFSQSAAFVITIWNGNAADCMADRIRQLTELGCTRAIPAGFLFWKYSDIFLPCYPLDLPHKVLMQKDRVRAAFGLWSDEASAREYLAQLEFRLHLNYDGLRTPGGNHYFAGDVYRLSARETLIDCGAFDGDTIGSFIARQGEHFSRILAYEPDPLNWEKLQQAVAALPEPIRGRIACFPQAVGSATGRVAFEASGTDLSATGVGETSVECVTLDESLRGVKPTILKFDIEGAELQALAGAAHTIRTHAPVLAVSAYHLQNHLWEIPLLISSLYDDYHFCLRPHGTEGWDLVCYAVPARRRAFPSEWERNCPVCAGSGRRTLFTQSFEQLSGHDGLHVGYDVVACTVCGAAFADHVPPQSVFDAYYRDLSKYEEDTQGVSASPYAEARSRQIAATILPHLPDPRARVLEIGCASGLLLSVLKEQGLVNVRGIDPSPGCAQTVNKRYGIPAEAQSIFDIPRPAEPFDFLILVGVMEHIRDLDKAVDKIRELLAPRGRVYLAVPDAARFAGVMDAPFQEFSVEHLNFFSAASLTNLMQRRGFRFLAGGPLRYEVGRGAWSAAVYGVFENDPPGALPCARDEDTETGLNAYIHTSEQAAAKVDGIIRELAASARPIFVWGTGAHTLHLLAAGGLDQVNIRAFVDSNPKYQGRQLHSRPVLAPRELAGRPEPILISSYAAQHEISRQIRDSLQLTNEIITLYQPEVQTR